MVASSLPRLREMTEGGQIRPWLAVGFAVGYLLPKAGNPMTEQESLEAAIHERVEIVPYDRGWPGKFEAERARLLSLFPSEIVAIEHFGSTAVPGMSAKPIIDILGGVRSWNGIDALSRRLCENGYSTSAEFNATLNDRQWFMRWANGRRTHHLHLVVHEAEPWRERLAFRDHLRVDPNTSARYERLKINLAQQHEQDREAYTAAKAEFVRSFRH